MLLLVVTPYGKTVDFNIGRKKKDTFHENSGLRNRPICSLPECISSVATVSHTSMYLPLECCKWLISLFFLTLLAPCVFLFACSCFWVFVVLKINRGRKEMEVKNHCVFTYEEWICKEVFVVLNLFLHQSSASPIAMFLCKYTYVARRGRRL